MCLSSPQLINFTHIHLIWSSADLEQLPCLDLEPLTSIEFESIFKLLNFKFNTNTNKYTYVKMTHVAINYFKRTSGCSRPEMPEVVGDEVVGDLLHLELTLHDCYHKFTTSYKKIYYPSDRPE